ncbi:hypothetical protein COCSADRAFT_200174 [Bipolaris sorokiniana ND90Pr]|uniref:Uncharacterized protein n=1 Tax=Cochliobolus sativus (strain ND90Pr / ATCC 201652) TaxID=665912 RepID=M2T3R9_COCSN|nr:uncharacterized protein COCSADRAFT_200174 [Bipolaris sorokiniana ND90Pr]EMD63637.1 hypothetical protein COCSADRAFT_200174 [Bipolaris sorokiniana ND90Pr]
MKSLCDLPNEILLQVFSCVDLHREARILGYIPDEPLPSCPDYQVLKDFRLHNSWLLNIALTCKRFAALIPEAVLHVIVLEAVAPFVQPERPQLCWSAPFALLLQLKAKPDLIRHIKQLRIHLPYTDEHDRYRCDNKGMAPMLASLCIPSAWKIKLFHDMTTSFGRGSFNVLLALVVLDVLCVSEPTDEPKLEWAEQLSVSPFTPPIIRSLRYLKIESVLPPAIQPVEVFQKLNTVDLSIALCGQSPLDIVSASEKYLANTAVKKIKHLHLNFEVRTIGMWNSARRTCMSNVVKGFQNLESLIYYAEASVAKNPYRSVRSFPDYQANIQIYPDVSSSPELVEGYWDQAIYEARTTVTDYQCLVDNLVHLRPSLKHLQLPGGFWTLPGAARKPIPRFDQFTQLRKLIVPQAALVSIKLDNMRVDTVSQGDFELSASLVLPVSLQHLMIFDLNETFLDSKWLQGLFSEQKSHSRWPEFRTLELLMGPTFSDEVLEALLARRVSAAFWVMVDEAGFDVVVGRDALDPSLLPDLR